MSIDKEKEHRKQLTHNINSNVDKWNNQTIEQQQNVVEHIKDLTSGAVDFTDFIGKELQKVKGV